MTYQSKGNRVACAYKPQEERIKIKSSRHQHHRAIGSAAIIITRARVAAQLNVSYSYFLHGSFEYLSYTYASTHRTTKGIIDQSQSVHAKLRRSVLCAHCMNQSPTIDEQPRTWRPPGCKNNDEHTCRYPGKRSASDWNYPPWRRRESNLKSMGACNFNEIVPAIYASIADADDDEGAIEGEKKFRFEAVPILNWPAVRRVIL